MRNQHENIEMSAWRILCLIQFITLLIIFSYLGLTPSPEQSAPMFNDKLMHFSGYFVAAFSITFAFPRTAFHFNTFFLISFSIGIEIAQHFMPPRTFDVFDICANSSGVVAGLIVTTLLTRYIPWFSAIRYFHSNN